MTHAPAAAGTRPPSHPIDRPTAHIGALDSIRGLAAVAVVLHHLGLGYASLHGFDVTAAGPFWQAVNHTGHSAVIIFFVLSGFVLQTSYARTTDFAYLPYLAKRIARVYPALVVAVLASAALHAATGMRPMVWLGHQLNESAEALHDPTTILRHLLLLMMGPPDYALDSPIWSLAYEMRFSLVFPPMAFFLRRRPGWFVVAVSLLYAACMAWLLHRHETPPWMFGYGRLRALVLSLLYLFCFGVGMAGAQWFGRRRFALPRPMEALLIAAALIVLGSVRDEVLSSFAALALIVCAIAPGSLTARLGGQRWALWLGRISYSLYLLHAVVILYVVALVGRVVPFGVTASLILILALGLAYLSYRFVERPGMRAGRELAGRLAA